MQPAAWKENCEWITARNPATNKRADHNHQNQPATQAKEFLNFSFNNCLIKQFHN